MTLIACHFRSTISGCRFCITKLAVILQNDFIMGQGNIFTWNGHFNSYIAVRK